MGSFSEMILQELIPMFDESDLELLIGGLSEIYMYVHALVRQTALLTLTRRGQGRLDEVDRLSRAREDGPGDRVLSLPESEEQELVSLYLPCLRSTAMNVDPRPRASHSLLPPSCDLIAELVRVGAMHANSKHIRCRCQ